MEKENFEQQWENLTLADDFLFGKIMSDPILCAEMLRRIFPNLDIGEIKIIETQKTLKYALYIRVCVSTFSRVLYEVFLRSKLKTICLKIYFLAHDLTKIVIGYDALNKKSLKKVRLL